MVIDAITFHNEYDLFDLRYNMLKDVVDEFVVVESTSTFAALPKPLNFERFKDKYPKVKYYVNRDEYTPEEIAFAKASPNTGGIDRWVLEFLQKESIQKALTHLNDDDLVFVGDVDEIWDAAVLQLPDNGIKKLRYRVYTYYLNLRSNEDFCGTILTKYKNIKDQCLNHLRNNGPNNTKEYYGWHFTNMGGFDALKMKIFDQYNPEVFNTQTWANLNERYGKADFIGRDFILKEDESEWPEYLKINKERYKHLCKF